ncbi:hypothetical protein CR513_12910, partial [Mucuna pruriens]
MSTLMRSTSILSLDETNKKVDQTSYRGMIDSLLYLTSSRPNIMFSVCLCACFQFDPRESHLTIVLLILVCAIKNLISTNLKKEKELLEDSTSLELAIVHTTLKISEPSPSSPIQPIVQTVLDNPTQITIQTPSDDYIVHKPMDSPDPITILKKE